MCQSQTEPKKDVRKKFIPGDINFSFGKNVQFVFLRVLYMISNGLKSELFWDGMMQEKYDYYQVIKYRSET